VVVVAVAVVIILVLLLDKTFVLALFVQSKLGVYSLTLTSKQNINKYILSF